MAGISVFLIQQGTVVQSLLLLLTLAFAGDSESIAGQGDVDKAQRLAHGAQILRLIDWRRHQKWQIVLPIGAGISLAWTLQS